MPFKPNESQREKLKNRDKNAFNGLSLEVKVKLLIKSLKKVIVIVLMISNKDMKPFSES